LIKIQNILTLAVIISLILPLQYNTLKFVNGEMKTDSTLVMYDDTNSKHPFLPDSKNIILKPKVDVSIEGTLNDDKMKGGDGDDKIKGEEGYDTLSGGKGNDKINGGQDDDIINGELGNDTLKGGNGDDKISGESENDLIEGGKGDDILLAGIGDDGVLGDEGNDVLNGSEGSDMMAGGLGNDTFICDLNDTIVDFNPIQGDKTVGQCSPENRSENEASYADFTQVDVNSSQIPPSLQSPQYNDKIIPPEAFKPGPPLQSPPPFTHDDIPPEDFGSFRPYPVPPSNEKYVSGFHLN
jgi:RTX calcium-binding nonapeptide repeat (4 copies)